MRLIYCQILYSNTMYGVNWSLLYISVPLHNNLHEEIEGDGSDQVTSCGEYAQTSEA